MHKPKRSILLLAFSLLAMIGPGVRATTANQFVLSPEDNHLWAYDAATGQAQLVVHAVNGADPGVSAPPGAQSRDINGQICVSPDGHHVITGEDTVIGSGSSHDPRIAGWGYHAIAGTSLGHITTHQEGKLSPAAGRGPTYTGDPDNYGCGFLDSNRLVTTAIGNTLPGEDANGQLFLWFGPFDSGFTEETDGGVSFFVGAVDHCEIDHTLATAGGIAVDKNGDVYVATNRPDFNGAPGGIWRYRGTWPTTYEECTPAFLAANITKTLVIPAIDALPADPRALTPSMAVISPDDTLYVSSVFTGTVSEFTKGGQWVRDIFPLSPVAPRTGPTGDTPFGLAFTSDGSLWIADLGIVLAEPVAGLGSVIKVSFTDGQPEPLGQRIAENLTYPDGLGVYTP